LVACVLVSCMSDSDEETVGFFDPETKTIVIQTDEDGENDE